MGAMLGKNQKLLDRINIEIVKEDDTYCYSINTEKGHLYLAQSEQLKELKDFLLESIKKAIEEVEEWPSSL